MTCRCPDAPAVVDGGESAVAALAKVLERLATPLAVGCPACAANPWAPCTFRGWHRDERYRVTEFHSWRLKCWRSCHAQAVVALGNAEIRERRASLV